MDEQTAVMQYRMAAEPAFQGYIETTLDALLIFEACQRGICPRVTRRLHERERRQIGSGSVYVFDEREAGIKRWTDGRVWSPSRILQNFLVYRELDKRATLTNHGQDGGPASLDEGSGHHGPATPSGMAGSTSSHDGRPRSTSDAPGTPEGISLDRNRERALVGSLTSSYRFRADGLVKKTISVSGLHMITYYKIDDVVQGRLRTPSSHPELAALEISPGFLVNQNFRVTPQIEIGPDGRPRYRGEGEEGLSGPAPPGSLQPLPAPGSALAYAYVPGPFDKPSRPPSDDSGNSHAGSPASSHLALSGPSAPGVSISDPSPPRPTYGRGLSSQSSGPGRSSISVSSQGVRYEPYGRPNTSSAPSISYYPPGGSNGAANTNNTAGFGGYPVGDHMAAAISGQRPAPPPAWAGRIATANTAPYYGPSPPASATEGRSFESQQQSLQGYPQYRAGASSSHYHYADDLTDTYRSASVPPIASQSDTAASDGTPTTSVAPPEPRPSSATYHNLWLPDEAPPPSYLAAGGRNYLSSSSRRPSAPTSGTGPGPTRSHYDGTGTVGPLRGPSPYHQYVAPPAGGTGSPAAAFRPASASSNSAYSSLHENSRGGGATGAGCTNGRSVSSGSPLLSPSEGHQTLPGHSLASPMTGSLPAMTLQHKEENVGGMCLPIARLGGSQGVALPPPMTSVVTSGMGPSRKSLSSWQSLGTSWPPFKQEG